MAGEKLYRKRPPKGWPLWVLGGLILLAGCAYRPSPRPLISDCRTLEMVCSVPADHSHFYSRKSLTLLGAGLGAGALMANNDFDEEVRQWYQEDIRTSSGDSFADVVKHGGEGRYAIPVIAGSLLLGDWLEERNDHGSLLSEWGGRSLRAGLVGGPPMVVLQSAIGASRPGESSAESDWKPFNDDNGVSGHTFVGAVPWITAAKMTDDPWKKAGFYFISTLPGWSRINDDAHYTSQCVLGWWIAYLACTAVDGVEWDRYQLRIAPVPVPGGAGLGVAVEY